jgi:hypothetical protein
MIQSYAGNNLEDEPWSYKQIKRAVELGLGAQNERAYAVIGK